MHWQAPVRGLCSARCTMGHGRCRPYCTTAQRLAMRSVPNDGGVVFPLTPHCSPQSQPDPASESDQHLGPFTKAEIVAPAPHIRDQLFHCRRDADALGPARDVPDSLFEPFQGLRRDHALDFRTSRKAEPEELPLLRSCHRALCLVDLELELLRDEPRDAVHHPLTRAFAANVNVTVIRIAN